MEQKREKPEMRELLLVSASDALGTTGNLWEAMADGSRRHLCHTTELPWLDDQPNVSCLRPGRYPLELYLSKNKGFVVPQLRDTAPRTYIQFHPQILCRNPWLLGCISPSKETPAVHTPSQRCYASTGTHEAFAELMELFEGHPQPTAPGTASDVVGQIEIKRNFRSRESAARAPRTA